MKRLRSPVDVTSCQMADMLPQMLAQISARQQVRPDLVVAIWPEVVGTEIAKMTRAVSFVEGKLLVRVLNAALYSLLQQHERGRLLESLRRKFPNVEIRNIVFRIG